MVMVDWLYVGKVMLYEKMKCYGLLVKGDIEC